MTIPYDAKRHSLYKPANLELLDAQEKIIKDFFSKTIVERINAQTDMTRQEAALCAELSRLVYLKFEEGDNKLQMLKDSLRLVDLTLIGQFASYETDTQGFVAENKDNIILVFRGTEGDKLKDLITDVLCRKETLVKLGISGKVHKGFANAFNSVKETVETALKNCKADKPILICGHSLGAALAILAGAVFAPTYQQRIRLYTFGSPRVGDDTFVASLSQLCHQRYVDYRDIVARVPLSFLGYRHTGTLNFIDESGEIINNDIDNHKQPFSEKIQIAKEIIKNIQEGDVLVRDFSDHAPINYVSAVLNLRS